MVCTRGYGAECFALLEARKISACIDESYLVENNEPPNTATYESAQNLQMFSTVDSNISSVSHSFR